MRIAEAGDRGTVVNATTERGSGLATLHIQTGPDREQDIVLLHGDYRMILDIAVHLDGDQVEVVEDDEDSDGLSVRHILFEGGCP